MNFKKYLLAVGLLIGMVFANATPAQALSYGGGTYTNLCGTGTAATAHTCNAGCNTNTGSCAASNEGVVKYTCAGNQAECRSNESAFANSQSLAGASCGQTIQIDVFNKKCRDASGNWTCSQADLKDYIVWYSGDCPAPQPPVNTCELQMPVNTQFRRSGNSTWVSGNDINNLKLTPGSKVDVNCFAKNGSALLEGGYINVRYPNGQTQRISNTSELRNFTASDAGVYTFTCASGTINQCSNVDSFTIQSNPTPTPTPSPTPSPSPTPEWLLCEDLVVVSGANSTVPAKVTLELVPNKAHLASRYRFWFGDGESETTSNQRIEHTYETSGSFSIRGEIRDAKGQWITSNNCRNRVEVKPNPVESHKARCSDVFIEANNGGRAPSTVKFNITGYDNKGDISQYRLDFGNGVVKEGTGAEFEQLYEQAGTYTIKGYIKDSRGNWHGGDSGCKRTLYVGTQPITTQPATGTPTTFLLMGLGSGLASSTLYLLRRQAGL